jgi:hypothetical protein
MTTTVEMFCELHKQMLELKCRALEKKRDVAIEERDEACRHLREALDILAAANVFVGPGWYEAAKKAAKKAAGDTK